MTIIPALVIAWPLWAQPSMPRTDQNSIVAHQELLAKSRQGRIEVYFEGDSITRRWGATDYPGLLANWKQNFFGWNAANFGWGADNNVGDREPPAGITRGPQPLNVGTKLFRF